MTAGHDRTYEGHDRIHEEKLARAAAALAEAEGMAAARAGLGWAPKRAGWPPPEDPQAATPDADPESVARAIVLRQLTLAPRSRAQLEAKLRQRSCDEAVAARVLDRMTEVGLVDDEAYAELLVRWKRSTKGLARRALAHELRKSGIDPDTAQGALDQVEPPDERTAAEALVAKKMRSMHGLGADVQARRLAGMLARKGYSAQLAWPVIRDAIADAAEHRRD